MYNWTNGQSSWKTVTQSYRACEMAASCEKGHGMHYRFLSIVYFVIGFWKVIILALPEAVRKCLFTQQKIGGRQWTKDWQAWCWRSCFLYYVYVLHMRQFCSQARRRIIKLLFMRSTAITCRMIMGGALVTAMRWCRDFPGICSVHFLTSDTTNRQQKVLRCCETEK